MFLEKSKVLKYATPMIHWLINSHWPRVETAEYRFNVLLCVCVCVVLDLFRELMILKLVSTKGSQF